MKIPKSHPRYVSLGTRKKLEAGVGIGITSTNGLIAHGRGEAFDYLLGERTHPFAIAAIDQAAWLLKKARHPVISINGNTAALVPNELVQIAELLNAPLEINLFHSSPERIVRIKDHLTSFGAKNILVPNRKFRVPGLVSSRKYVNPAGIWNADVIFVPLEDGDRTEALTAMGKTVVTVDLNPLSRTAQNATVTIVDNVVRAAGLLAMRLKKKPLSRKKYSQYKTLHAAEMALRGGRRRG